MLFNVRIIFSDYTEFYNQRYPQEMMDPTLRSDTIHWNPKTYTEMIVSVIREIQLRREIAKQTVMVPVTGEVTMTDVDAVLYTNENTVIFARPDWNAQILFPLVEAGLPIHVTGITDNGFFCVDLGETAAYIHGAGRYTLEENHEPDLYKILFPAEQHYEAQRMYADDRPYEYAGRMHSLDDITIQTMAADGAGRSILVYRDSFGRAMIPYMGGVFDTAVFNRSTPYGLSVVENTACDYVLFEIVERNLADLGQMQIP